MPSSLLLIAGQIALMIVLGFILIKATKLTASAIEALVNHSHQRKFGLIVFFVALSTSLPELVVTLIASSQGQGELALSNILGANIANLSLILGGAALIAGTLRATDTLVTKEITSVFLITCLPLLLLMDRHLSRWDGLALVLLYILYIRRELHRSRQLTIPSPQTQQHIKQLLHHFTRHTLIKRLGLASLGLLVMILSGQGLVMVATSLASLTHLPAFLIGLFLISIGTSLPELAFEIVAIRHHQSTMAFGNIIGSLVANGTVVLGLAALIQPITITTAMPAYLISNIAFILIFGLFWLFARTKHRLVRLEGLFLVVAYLLFALAQSLLI